MKQYRINASYDAVLYPFSVCEYFFRQDTRNKRDSVPFFFPFRRIFLHNNFYDMGYTKDLVFPDRIKYFPGESHHLFFPHALLDE